MHLLGLFPVLLTLTPLAQSIDIQLSAGLGCTGSSWKYLNVPAHHCLQTPSGVYSSSQMSAGVTGIEPGMIVYAYNGSEGNWACDWKNVKDHFTSTGKMNFWQCFYSYHFAAFGWDYYDPNVSEMERKEMKCEGVKGPDLITLVDGTEIDLYGMEDEERDELWELAVKGAVMEDLPTKFANFMRE